MRMQVKQFYTLTFCFAWMRTPSLGLLHLMACHRLMGSAAQCDRRKRFISIKKALA